MKLIIDNRDLAYTIDTYSMFNGEGWQEGEQEWLGDQYDLGEEQFDLAWDFDHPAIVKAFAINSVGLLKENVEGDIITDITLDNSKSPQFYNYTTDSYTAEWTFDRDKLLAWTADRWAEYETFVRENWSTVDNNVNWNTRQWLEYNYTAESYDTTPMTDNETVIVSMLDYYTRTEYDPESYNSEMFELEPEVWTENSNLDSDSQWLIDSKEIK